MSVLPRIVFNCFLCSPPSHVVTFFFAFNKHIISKWLILPWRQYQIVGSKKLFSSTSSSIQTAYYSILHSLPPTVAYTRWRRRICTMTMTQQHHHRHTTCLFYRSPPKNLLRLSLEKKSRHVSVTYVSWEATTHSTDRKNLTNAGTKKDFQHRLPILWWTNNASVWATESDCLCESL